jgi:LysM domain
VNPRTIALSAVLVAAGAASARAQPEPTPGSVPGYPAATEPAPLTIPMGGDDSAPAPAAEPAAPSAPAVQVIRIGPDGNPVPEPAAAPSGYYVDDTPEGPTEDEGLATLHAGPTPELHEVRSGDTLWDICWYYFNDPWQWPKVWSYNPQITNPHWIYPGDLVRLVPHGMTTPAPLPTDVEAAPPTPDLGTEPAPARSFGVALRQVAFLDNDALDTAITIDGAVEPKTLLSAGDVVYLKYPDGHPPTVGKTYSIYTIGHEVDHPRTHKKVGAYVHLLGTLEVQSVKQDKRATAVILGSYAEIVRGTHVGPLQRELRTVPPSRDEVDAQGTIVAMLTADQLIGAGEVVFVDLGAQSGLKVGNRMYVVRRGDPLEIKARSSVGQDDRRFPAHAVGEVVIVDVGKHVSIGLVTLAVQELGVGDLVMMRAAK